MPETRTVAPVITCLRYRDAPAAIDWLCEAFGFERHLVVDGPEGTIAHAQLTFGAGMIMLGSEGAEQELEWPVGGASLYVIVDDADAHHDRAVAAGAELVVGLQDPDYGGRMYTVRDPEGNLWSFGTYRP